MNKFLHHWQLSLSQPLHIDEQIIPSGFANPAFDMHSAIHLGIILEGDLFLEQLPLNIFLTSSWQLHGNTSSQTGAKLLLFTFIPEAILNCIPGTERATVRSLFYTSSESNYRRFNTLEIKTQAIKLATQYDILKKNYSPAVTERKIWLKLVDFLCDAALSVGDCEHQETGGKFQKIAPVFSLLGARQYAPLTPAQAAKACCLSESYFHHIFKECMGMSFSLYELYFRLNGAAADLAAGVGIKQIASDWGFCDSSHFSSTFKFHFGVSPSRYRS